MTQEEVAMVVTDAIRAVLSDPAIHCRYKFEPETHEAEHEALRKFIKVVGRIEDIKWGVLQKLVLLVVTGACALMVYGGLMKLKLFGG
jgi:hypothetical protein